MHDYLALEVLFREMKKAIFQQSRYGSTPNWSTHKNIFNPWLLPCIAQNIFIKNIYIFLTKNDFCILFSRMNRRRKGVAGIKAKQAKADVLKAEGEKIQNEEFAHMEAQARFWLAN